MIYETISFGDRSLPVQFRGGSADAEVFKQVNVNHEYDLSRLDAWPDIQAYYASCLVRGVNPLIVDGGAHVGMASIWFRLMFPDASILAYEIERENFSLLLENTAEFQRFFAANRALMGVTGGYTVVDNKSGTWGYSAAPSLNGKINVTIPSIYDSTMFLESPFIVKLDVEGEEENILRWHRRWLSKTPIVIVECHDWVKDKSVFDVLKDGRECTDIGENVVSISRGLLCGN